MVKLKKKKKKCRMESGVAGIEAELTISFMV